MDGHHGFKEYCALLFIKGALLKDPERILIQQTENVRTSRQVRFSNVYQIGEMQRVLEGYIKEAIEVEKAGLKVELKSTTAFNMPEVFHGILEDLPELKAALTASC
jgi:uncharacterized protein YdeI (YjbR/CyaY-like superfamily)